MSQEAADQVFDDVSARFRDVGGMRGYQRQQRQEKKDRFHEDWAWEKAGGFSSAGVGADEKEKLEGMEKVALAAEVERQEREKILEDEVAEEEAQDEFTMATMLDMLNIEYSTIGWDEKCMSWV